MAFKVFTPGVLTSSDVNTFLMRQAVIVCTSTTRPASPNEGMTIYETDTDVYQTYTGTAWVNLSRFIVPNYISYTPTWTGLTIGNAPTNVGLYSVIGKTVHIRVRIVFGSTTTITATGSPGDTGPICGFPSGFSAGGGQGIAQQGVARFVDDSAGIFSVGTCNLLSAGLQLQSLQTSPGSYAFSDVVTSSVPFAWAVGDEIRLNLVYGIG
jgi:hypothetical protein